MSTRPPALRTGILLLLMVVLLAGTGWFGYKSLTAPIAKAGPTCNSQTVAGSLSSSQVTVRVYNAGTQNGLAASIQKQLQGKGFQVPYVGNSSQAIEETTIVGSKIDAPEVKLVAGFFPKSKITEDNRKDHTVDVIVGDSFGGLDETAPTQIAVQQAVICASPSPTATPSATPTPTGTPSTPETPETSG